jgi:uncharacterized protein YndB with AHSA1/START domain
MSDSDREHVSSVLLDATQEQVWDAYADGAKLARWWGPDGFTNTFHQFEFEPGGRWRFDMHGPNGVSSPNESVFVELARPERIVLDHVVSPLFRMTVTLTARGRQTELVWRMRFETAEVYRSLQALIAKANEENFDRLGRLLFQGP